jgi:S-phase kinase-associated protein 1
MSLDENFENRSGITLISSNGISFLIGKRECEMSGLLQNMIENDKEATSFFLENIKPQTLSKIVLYLQYRFINPPTPIEKPLRSNKMEDIVDGWDAFFIDVRDDELFDLILASNYMNIPSLLDLSCAKVATYMKGKSAEQIRQRFNIENDLTEAEVNAIKEENKWALESDH